MRSKVIPSWKVQYGAQTDTHTHTDDIIFLPLDYLYSHGQKLKKKLGKKRKKYFKKEIEEKFFFNFFLFGIEGNEV